MSALDLAAIGREIVGPALALQLRLALEWIERRGIDRVYCLAGDGQLAHELGARLSPGRALRYLEVSRRSTRLAALKRLGPREVRWPTLAGILDALGLDDDEVRAAVRRTGYRAFERPIETPWTDVGLQKLLDDAAFQSLFAARAADARARLTGYLRAQDFFAGGRAALLGTGWRALVQDHLTAVGAGEAGQPELYGFYVGLLPSQPASPRESLERKVGTLFDWRREAGEPALDWMPLLHLFEWSGKADASSVIGYGDDLRPIRDRPVEAASVEAARRALREGARAGIDEASARGTPASLLAERERLLERVRRFAFSAEWRALRGLVDEKWTDRGAGRSWLRALGRRLTRR